MSDVDPIAVLREDTQRCPVHGIPDCSPLLNGCSRPNRSAAALAQVEALVEAAHALDARSDDWVGSEEEREDADALRAALSPFPRKEQA